MATMWAIKSAKCKNGNAEVIEIAVRKIRRQYEHRVRVCVRWRGDCEKMSGRKLFCAGHCTRRKTLLWSPHGCEASSLPTHTKHYRQATELDTHAYRRDLVHTETHQYMAGIRIRDKCGMCGVYGAQCLQLTQMQTNDTAAFIAYPMKCETTPYGMCVLRQADIAAYFGVVVVLKYQPISIFVDFLSFFFVELNGLSSILCMHGFNPFRFFLSVSYDQLCSQ